MTVESSLITIPARCGRALRVPAGASIKVINTHGQQVVDTWAFVEGDTTEFMSMEHSRAQMGTVFPTVGSTLRSNHRRPMLSFTEDTSGGRHDTLIAACDPYRYQLLGCTEPHANCTENLHAALRELSQVAPLTPCPLNLFMNIPVDAAGGFTFEPPRCGPGAWVTLRAELDLIVVLSACPQDLVPVNGANCLPTEAHVVLLQG